MRRPAAIGFYPGHPEELRQSIEQCLPRGVPRREGVSGAVVPHAGYMYSGATAGCVYASLPHADTYVILGPNHTGMGSPVAVSVDTWHTPLGEVEVDREFVELLPRSIIDCDEIAHLREHSIEVQLPFLQFTQQDFQIVPICLGLQDEETALEVGEELRVAIDRSQKRVIVLASSDFTHYQPASVARKIDVSLIESILDFDIDGLYARLYELNATACGYGAIAAMLYTVSRLGASRAELLKYSTSGDVTGDTGSVVGYAGIIVE